MGAPCVREGNGVAAQVLVKLGADLKRVRQQVIQLLHGPTAQVPGPVVEVRLEMVEQRLTAIEQRVGKRLVAGIRTGRRRASRRPTGPPSSARHSAAGARSGTRWKLPLRNSGTSPASWLTTGLIGQPRFGCGRFLKDRNRDRRRV